jgi:hypothetical protein
LVAEAQRSLAQHPVNHDGGRYSEKKAAMIQVFGGRKKKARLNQPGNWVSNWIPTGIRPSCRPAHDPSVSFRPE